MTDLRSEAQRRKIAIRMSELDVEKLSEEEIKTIQQEVSKIRLSKLDDTKDYRGCLYSNNAKIVESLSTFLGFSKAKNNDSSQSCFQFIKQDGSRVKLYCKDLHLIQSTSTNKKISIGIKPIFVSRVFRERLAQCNETCMSRIEHSNKFNSIEEEQAFLLNKDTATTLNDGLNNTIDAINESSFLQQINCKVTRHELWKMFFESIQSTYIFKNKKQGVIIYAHNSKYSKYVGMFEESSLTSTELAAKFGIGTCNIFDIANTSNYSEAVKVKQSKHLQVPIIPGTYDLELLKEIGIDVDNLSLKSNLNTFKVGFKQAGEVKQVFLDVPQKEAEIQTAQEIEKQYSDHKAQIKKFGEMTSQTIIHGFRYPKNGKLTLYAYNDDIKFQRPMSTQEFMFLERLLDGLEMQHQVIQGMHVFVHGLLFKQIDNLFEQAKADHYCYLKRLDEDKQKAIEGGRKRKDEQRNRSASQKRKLWQQENSSQDQFQQSNVPSLTQQEQHQRSSLMDDGVNIEMQNEQIENREEERQKSTSQKRVAIEEVDHDEDNQVQNISMGLLDQNNEEELELRYLKQKNKRRRERSRSKSAKREQELETPLGWVYSRSDDKRRRFFRCNKCNQERRSDRLMHNCV